LAGQFLGEVHVPTMTLFFTWPRSVLCGIEGLAVYPSICIDLPPFGGGLMYKKITKQVSAKPEAREEKIFHLRSVASSLRR
jgi:hypothetical protein